ncbi:hypothetical protein [Microbacterium sp. XT11]|uniref:hypothetical protein n=1 Tax=Microbacterium sp. XT11 TaxID=367477 RepID=UPI000742FA74|nr:hypothetical protein [Microbacterium sp. XT11]ALX66175.1 hypothetical protein AB663_001116 [Microbacterium sp. XT11]
MPFFPPDPDVPEPEPVESEQPAWWQAPEDELPVILPISEFLARTDQVALVLAGVAVHSEGIAFRVERLIRRNGIPMREWNELCQTFMEHMAPFDATDVAGRLRFGVELADGEKVLADPHPFLGHADPSFGREGHVLSRLQRGGGGSGSTYSAADELWLWPLPPAGPIDVVLQWPALGIDETHVTIDVGSVEEPAARARRYWPS